MGAVYNIHFMQVILYKSGIKITTLRRAYPVIWLAPVFLIFSFTAKKAERQGFEPWEPAKAQRFSRPPRSTAPAPLRYYLEIKMLTLNKRFRHVCKAPF